MARALITGATAGIGNAFAKELAARGTDLVLVARDRERLEATAAELSEVHGIEVELLPADLSVRDDVMKVAQRLESETEPVDMLVNNAGFGLHASLLDASQIELHERAMDVMCLAMLILGGAAGRTMKVRGRGPDHQRRLHLGLNLHRQLLRHQGLGAHLVDGPGAGTQRHRGHRDDVDARLGAHRVPPARWDQFQEPAFVRVDRRRQPGQAVPAGRREGAYRIGPDETLEGVVVHRGSWTPEVHPLVLPQAVR